MSVALDVRTRQARAHRRFGWPWIIAASVVVVALVVAWLIFDHWRNGLRLLGPVGDEVGADRMAIGRTFYAPAVWSPGHSPLTLAVTSLRPEVTDDTAHANVRIVLCTPRRLSDGMPGAAAWSLTEWCSNLRPFTPGTYRLCPYGSAQGCVAVYVAVTARTSGHVHLDGTHIKYQRGIRPGDQLVGTAIDTTTP
ncbi:MAG TPA: hypothetical protein VE442_05520 [Jatrophihabitans sp.]|nr:hypothetical protein [Jatrophihabitans sp.]